MINDKTAKRIQFAEEYDGDNFDYNPQLKFMIAKSIEPEEIRHKLQKARQVQQAIIMQTEQNTTELDADTYANLQPKVFRKEPDKGYKREKYIDEKQQLVIDAKKLRLQLQQKLEDEKKQTEIDVRRKNKGTVSYMHFFKPPKPLTSLSQQNSKGASANNAINQQSHSENPQHQTMQNLTPKPAKTLTAYEKKQLNLHGSKRIVNSLQYAIMQEVNSTLKKQAIMMIIQQARSQNPDKKGILRLAPGLKEPENYKEEKNRQKAYKYYGERQLEESDEEVENEVEKRFIEKNTVVRSYEPPKNKDLFKPKIAKKEELKFNLKNNRLDYDEALEKVKSEIEKQKDRERSRNQGMDLGPQYPQIQPKGLKNTNFNTIQNSIQMTSLESISPFANRSQMASFNRDITISPFPFSTQAKTTQFNTMNTTNTLKNYPHSPFINTKSPNEIGRFSAELIFKTNTQTDNSQDDPAETPLRKNTLTYNQILTYPISTINNSLANINIMNMSQSKDPIDIRKFQIKVQVDDLESSLISKNNSPFYNNNQQSHNHGRQVTFKINKIKQTDDKNDSQSPTHIRSEIDFKNSASPNHQQQFETSPQNGFQKGINTNLTMNSSQFGTPAYQEKKKNGFSMFKMNQPASYTQSLERGKLIAAIDCENYSQIQGQLPKIKLKSLKMTHDDYVAQRQKKFELEGREHHAMLLNQDQKDFFINQSKGGNKQYRVAKQYDNDITLLKPTMDASDKEIFKRNGMASAAEQLKQLVNAKERLQSQDKTFLPSQFGQQSEPKELGERIVRNKIKQPTDIDDASIIVRRQVNQLFEKIGHNLINNLNNYTNLKMNSQLSDFFGKGIILQSLTHEDKEKKIKEYLQYKIEQQMTRQKQFNRDLNDLSLEKIDEDIELDFLDSSRNKKNVIEQEDANPEDIFLQQYNILKAQQQKSRNMNANKDYKKNMSRQVQLGMIKGKRYDSNNQQKQDYESILGLINWNATTQENQNRKRNENDNESEEDDDFDGKTSKGYKQLQFKKIRCLNEENQIKQEEQKQRIKDKEKIVIEKLKKLKKEVHKLDQDKQKDILSKILRERDMRERNLNRINAKIKEFEKKKDKLNAEESESTSEHGEVHSDHRLQNDSPDQYQNQESVLECPEGLKDAEKQPQTFRDTIQIQEGQLNLEKQKVGIRVNEKIDSFVNEPLTSKFMKIINQQEEADVKAVTQRLNQAQTLQLSNAQNKQELDLARSTTFSLGDEFKFNFLNRQNQQASLQNQTPIVLVQDNQDMTPIKNIRDVQSVSGSIATMFQQFNKHSTLQVSNSSNRQNTVSNQDLQSLQQAKITKKGTVTSIRKNSQLEQSEEQKDQNKQSSLIKKHFANILQSKSATKKIEEDQSEQIDYKIHHENELIQKVRSILEQNLKNRVGTGLNKSVISLMDSHKSENYNGHTIPGILSMQYRKDLSNLKSKVHQLDDLFISKNGVLVKPERIRRNKHQQEITNQLTEFEMIDLLRERKKKMYGFDIQREVMKIKIHENREFFKNLDNPVNDVEKEVNDNIKNDLRKRKREMQKFKLLDKPVHLKKLPLIDDMKFSNMTIKSLAEKKRVWKGEEGRYKTSELTKWFKVYEETKLYQIRKDLGKSDKYDEFQYLRGH